MPKPVVVCVCRSGGDFNPDHVSRLYKQVARHSSELHFVALTDMMASHTAYEVRPLLWRYPGWWSKLELFAPEQDQLGDILYLDLDTTVIGSLLGIAAVGTMTMLQDFMRPARLASGVMYLTLEARQRVWEVWKADPEQHMRTFARKGDQHFIEIALAGYPVERFQDVLPGQIVSYKVHVEQHGRVPAKARLVCFHGKPRPWEVSPL